MDWVINIELQFSEAEAGATPEEARAYAKALLEVCIQEKYLNHYHLLSEPKRIDG